MSPSEEEPIQSTGIAASKANTYIYSTYNEMAQKPNPFTLGIIKENEDDTQHVESNPAPSTEQQNLPTEVALSEGSSMRSL